MQFDLGNEHTESVSSKYIISIIVSKPVLARHPWNMHSRSSLPIQILGF